MQRLINLLPEYVRGGLLDAAGGNLAVRSAKGVHVTPSQAGEELGWQLSADDFVLFPGGGEASMARAGRRPSRESRLHCAVLGARGDWNCSYCGAPWGLLGYAAAGRSLPLSLYHSRLIDHHKAVTIPCLPEAPGGMAELATNCAQHLAGGSFKGAEYGALLLGGIGALVAGVDESGVLALALTLEKFARGLQ
jgi:ribulose-5-phosphate 4-epimerase/fuculose-1-phosphate aldolase